MNELVPITIDEIDSLKGMDKVLALKRYHEWLKKQRKQDIREDLNIFQRMLRIECKKVRADNNQSGTKKCLGCGRKISSNSAILCRPCSYKDRTGLPIIKLKGSRKQGRRKKKRLV
jgi:hypothetical protein